MRLTLSFPPSFVTIDRKRVYRYITCLLLLCLSGKLKLFSLAKILIHGALWKNVNFLVMAYLLHSKVKGSVSEIGKRPNINIPDLFQVKWTSLCQTASLQVHI